MSLSPQEEHDIREAFSIYGYLDRMMIPSSSLGSVMRALRLNPLEKEVYTLIAQYDPKGTGFISHSDVIDIYLSQRDKKDTIENLLNSFKLLDPENTGFISISDFRYYMCRMGEQISEQEFEDIIRLALGPRLPTRIDIQKFAKYLMDIREG